MFVLGPRLYLKNSLIHLTDSSSEFHTSSNVDYSDGIFKFIISVADALDCDILSKS